MGTTVHGVGKGGRRFPGLGKNICGGGPCGPAVWVGDVGYDTKRWEVVGKIPPQGGPQDEITETLEGEVREVDVSPAGGSDEGGRVTGGRELRLSSP